MKNFIGEGFENMKGSNAAVKAAIESQLVLDERQFSPSDCKLGVRCFASYYDFYNGKRLIYAFKDKKTRVRWIAFANKNVKPKPAKKISYTKIVEIYGALQAERHDDGGWDILQFGCVEVRFPSISDEGEIFWPY